ncbi:peptidylprolyl isomerase [Ferriphaselus sp. R-1]|uniref:peptidylprolyl isomerase n=1 Tax=Ferriphaselus sp. R-1 TaxID=1485544 RepID=UPI000557D66A|nr:peptidylprolyl isomerase [Ferriphaselus sp. R-1]
MYKKILVACLLTVTGLDLALAADPQTQVAPIDQIVVVVNEDVITRNELNSQLDSAIAQLKKQGTPLPEDGVLEKQVLERMITEMLQAQFAKETGIRIDDTQLDRTLQRIAQANNLNSLEEFRARVEQDGSSFAKFREQIRAEIASTRLREREVDAKIVISENEIDNFLANQERQGGKGEEFHLAHIFIGVPEQASAAAIRASQQRAEEALGKLQGGNSFAQVAAGYSDAKDGLTGGELGWRPAERIPPLFLEELKKLQPGGFSSILRSPNGFHILKLVERRDKNQAVLITQTHARHILIRTSELVPEKEARAKLAEIKRALDNGADFAEQAKLNSEDGSASKGGDLGWLSPGDTVPEFENGMNATAIGQVSAPIQSGFGFHLIQVLERRNQDVSVEQKRMQAKQSIRALKSDEAYQDWLRQLRDRAFVEYRENQ